MQPSLGKGILFWQSPEWSAGGSRRGGGGRQGREAGEDCQRGLSIFFKIFHK